MITFSRAFKHTRLQVENILSLLSESMTAHYANPLSSSRCFPYIPYSGTNPIYGYVFIHTSRFSWLLEGTEDCTKEIFGKAFFWRFSTFQQKTRQALKDVVQHFVYVILCKVQFNKPVFLWWVTVLSRSGRMSEWHKLLEELNTRPEITCCKGHMYSLCFQNWETLLYFFPTAKTHRKACAIYWNSVG